MIFDFLRQVFGLSTTPIKPALGFVPISEREIPADAIELIKHFESCLEPTGNGMFKAYPDPGRGWKLPTIGWGTVRYSDGSPVKRGDLISQKRADAEFEHEIAEKTKGVLDLIPEGTTDAQLGALVSFAYNEGLGALAKSTLLKKLQKGDIEGAADEFLKWNKSNGKVLRGLTRRRRAERAMFLGENWKVHLK